MNDYDFLKVTLFVIVFCFDLVLLRFFFARSVLLVFVICRGVHGQHAHEFDLFWLHESKHERRPFNDFRKDEIFVEHALSRFAVHIISGFRLSLFQVQLKESIIEFLGVPYM